MMDSLGYAIGSAMALATFGGISVIVLGGLLSAYYLVMRACMWLAERTPWLKRVVIKWRDNDRQHKQEELLRLLNAMSEEDLQALADKVTRLRVAKYFNDMSIEEIRAEIDKSDKLKDVKHV